MATEKCSLKAIPGPMVTASLNPKQFQVDKTVPWSKQVTNQNDAPALEFTHAEPKNLSVELLFDTYQDGGSVKSKFIDPLEVMTQVVAGLGHPPQVLFQWGSFKFYGAIESLSVSYTMFREDGTPCRATANIKMKEAERVGAGGGGGGGAEPDPNQEMRDKGRAGADPDSIHKPGTPLSS